MTLPTAGTATCSAARRRRQPIGTITAVSSEQEAGQSSRVALALMPDGTLDTLDESAFEGIDSLVNGATPSSGWTLATLPTPTWRC